MFHHEERGIYMGNEKNLNHKLTAEELRKGGKNSVKSRREKKLLKDCLEILLEKKINIEGKNMTGAEAIAFTAFEKALGGDIKSMEFVRDTAGQKPIERVIVSDIDPLIIQEVEDMVNKEI